MEEQEETRRAENNASAFAPKQNTAYPVSLSREEILEQLKYIGPILQSRIEYNNQVLPLLKEIRNLESQRSKIKNESSPAAYSQPKTVDTQMRIRSNLLHSLQHQIDEKLNSLREITDFEFNASQLDCFIYFKETDQKINMCAREIYRLIQQSSTDEELFNGIHILFAHLSTAAHLTRPFTVTLEEFTLMQQNGAAIEKAGGKLQIAGSAKSVNESENDHRDGPYHAMILQLVSPYCSEKTKVFHSFFARNNKGCIELSWTKYQDKIAQLFSNTLGSEHKMHAESSEALTRIAKEKTAKLWTNLISEADRGKVYFDHFFKKMNDYFAEGRIHRVIDTYSYFTSTYTDLHEDFFQLKLFCESMSATLSSHFQRYSEDLLGAGCVYMPNFLSVCQKILAQPDFAPIIYTGTNKSLTLEEKLSKLSLCEDGFEQAGANEEESPEKPRSSAKKKKEKKKAKKIKKFSVAACDADKPGSDGDMDEITAIEEYSDVAAASSKSVCLALPENVDQNSAVLVKVSNETKINHLDVAENQTPQEEKDTKNIPQSTIENSLLRVVHTEAAITNDTSTLAPWIINLLTMHEYNFKKTIRSVYSGLEDLGLNPTFITSNEKFVLGFISPLTAQPFAITEDVPHGSQLRKGQAAGWIKKIKRSLKEHHVIPTGY